MYSENDSIKTKILKIAQNIYGADDVVYSTEAEKSLAKIISLGKEKIPVCIAKTQYSLSDDPTKLGYPKRFNINIKNVYLSNGAGFIVVLTGNILQMPGLPKFPAAENIDINSAGKITGLF